MKLKMLQLSSFHFCFIFPFFAVAEKQRDWQTRMVMDSERSRYLYPSEQTHG
jgi:hypothetical protein